LRRREMRALVPCTASTKLPGRVRCAHALQEIQDQPARRRESRRALWRMTATDWPLCSRLHQTLRGVSIRSARSRLRQAPQLESRMRTHATDSSRCNPDWPEFGAAARLGWHNDAGIAGSIRVAGIRAARSQEWRDAREFQSIKTQCRPASYPVASRKFHREQVNLHNGQGITWTGGCAPRMISNQRSKQQKSSPEHHRPRLQKRN